MAKEVTGFIKLQIKGGAANPSPPVGPALGSKGLQAVQCPHSGQRRKGFACSDHGLQRQVILF